MIERLKDIALLSLILAFLWVACAGFSTSANGNWVPLQFALVAAGIIAVPAIVLFSVAAVLDRIHHR